MGAALRQAASSIGDWEKLPLCDSRAYIQLLPFCPFWLHQRQASLLLQYRTTSMQALSHPNKHDVVSTGVMLHP